MHSQEKSIIVFLQLEICLRMSADRADFRSILSDMNMTAVGADPDPVAVTGEHNALFDIRYQFAVTLFMLLLDLTDGIKKIGKTGKSLFLGNLCKLRIHISPLIVLAGGSILQIFDGAGDFSVMKLLEPDLGMFNIIL